jgi:restriction system protein
MGRAERGIVITTGSFTRDARTEATRDGAPLIDLLDGDQLLNKLKHLKLGVEVQTRTLEDVVVRTEFFDEI